MQSVPDLDAGVAKIRPKLRRGATGNFQSSVLQGFFSGAGLATLQR
jgi:hypothetical protein